VNEELCVLTGAPGSGKTAILDELRDDMRTSCSSGRSRIRAFWTRVANQLDGTS
jgi:predicted ATPase